VALSADGSVLAVGAHYWDGPAGSNQGAVYVFDWSGSAWIERTTALTASDAGASDYFGTTVALSADGTVLAVGAFGWDGPGGDDQGAVYVFDWSGSAWVERTTALTASDAGKSDYFGISVALSADGTVLAIGAYSWDGPGGANQGAVYVFDWSGSAWVERTTALTASDAGAYDYFGMYVALSADGSVLAVGAHYWDGPGGSNQGAVYVFDYPKETTTTTTLESTTSTLETTTTTLESTTSTLETTSTTLEETTTTPEETTTTEEWLDATLSISETDTILSIDETGTLLSIRE